MYYSINDEQKLIHIIQNFVTFACLNVKPDICVKIHVRSR